MKQVLFTLLFAFAIILTSCNKDKVYPNIKEYDDQQIQNYIAANRLTGMQRDMSDGDTSGIYYQITEQGTGDRIEYSDRVNMVYTLRSFDGKFISNDTILNHYAGYLGQFSSLGLPKGLQSGIYNILKNKGGAMRILIPSRLAYGINGTGSGSVANSSRIAGNQCLDYWVRIVDNQRGYDSVAIKNFAARHGVNLSEYSQSASGLYYKITGSDTGRLVSRNSQLSYSYLLRNFNNVKISEQTTSSQQYDEMPIAALREITSQARHGQSVSLLIPSRLAYGNNAVNSGNVTVIPAFSCLSYDYTITELKNY